MNEEFRKDNTPQRLSGDEFNDLWEERLKQEAIKWVKDIDKNEFVSAEWFIRKFFNLTEEELI